MSMAEEMKEVRERGHTTMGEDVDRDMPGEGGVARDVDTLTIRRCLCVLILLFACCWFAHRISLDVVSFRIWR